MDMCMYGMYGESVSVCAPIALCVCTWAYVWVHTYIWEYFKSICRALPWGDLFVGDMCTTKSTAYMPYFATMQSSKVGFPSIPLLVHTLANVLLVRLQQSLAALVRDQHCCCWIENLSMMVLKYLLCVCIGMCVIWMYIVLQHSLQSSVCVCVCVWMTL